MFDDILREFEVGLKQHGVDCFSVERVAHLSTSEYEAKIFTWYEWSDPMRDAKRVAGIEALQAKQEMESMDEAAQERESQLSEWFEAIHVVASMRWSAVKDRVIAEGGGNILDDLGMTIDMQSPAAPQIEIEQIQEIISSMRPTLGEHFKHPANSFHLNCHYVSRTASPRISSRIVRTTQVQVIDLPLLEIFRLRDTFDPDVKQFVDDLHAAAGKIAICHRAWEPCARQLIGLPLTPGQ